MKLHINTEQELTQLDKKIDFDNAGNHFPPYLFCSEETKEMLDKYKEERFPKLKYLEGYHGADIYYICQIIVDNTLPFGEIEIKEFG